MVNTERNLPRIPEKMQISKITLENILGDKMLQDPLKREYLDILFQFRIRCRQTGQTVRTDEEKAGIARILRENPNIVRETTEERKLIFKATPHSDNNNRVQVNPSAFVVYGDIKPGELELEYEKTKGN